MKIAMVFPLVLMGCALLGGRGDRVIEVTQGAVCGNPLILGSEIGRVESETPGCGVERAVSIKSVGGVLLSRESVMECSTARVLNAWVENDVDRILGIKGGGVSEIQVAAHYVCRTRNHKAGAKISEHGKGRAIDISAFTFADGSELSVKDHWGRGRDGRLLKRLHESACGPFATVLGPGSDGYHEDHFHFDTAQRDNDYTYCR
jgi:hypothetical protein